MNPTAGLATDARSLDRLKADAAKDPRAAIKQAANQFEALFMQQLLKSMREAIPKSGLMDGPGQDTYTSMLDAQLAQTISARPGGLSDVIAKQLTRHMKGLGEDPATGASEGAGALRLTPGLRSGNAGAIPDTAGLSAGQAEFVQKLWPQAALAQQASGVPAAYVVGQAALESGWGKREIRMPDGSSSHNLFGIKAGASWKGATVEATTTEYVDGQARKTVEKFRAYGSYAEAFRDWSALMANNPRYGQVLRSTASVGSYADGMQRAGYATDPEYASKLERTINRTLALRRLSV